MNDFSRDTGRTHTSVVLDRIQPLLAEIAAREHAVLARFSAPMIEQIFAATPRALIRGATAPKGIAEPVAGGYRVKGRWPLASGSYDYHWVIGNCVVVEGGKPRIDPSGAPELRR